MLTVQCYVDESRKLDDKHTTSGEVCYQLNYWRRTAGSCRVERVRNKEKREKENPVVEVTEQRILMW